MIKKPKPLILGQYGDNWNALLKLVDDLFLYYNSIVQYAKKIKYENFANLIEIHFTDDTKINPSFYPLIDSVLGFNGRKIILSPKWDKIAEKRRLKTSDIIDAKNRNWINVNSIYPNYENIGAIAINDLDTEKTINEDSTNTKVDGRIENWTVEIANVLDIINKFSSKDFNLLPLENRAIKYIAGEILANTFQHAFKGKKGRSDFGIFLNEESRLLQMTISDRGDSIPESIRNNNKIPSSKSDSNMIEWALGRGNTSKEELKQGGMGLYRMKRIVDGAEGFFAIKSSSGILNNRNKIISKSKTYYKWFGTIIYIELDLKKLKKEDLETSDNVWESMKEMFIT